MRLRETETEKPTANVIESRVIENTKTDKVTKPMTKILSTRYEGTHAHVILSAQKRTMAANETARP
jgi:hypothetical protein